MSTKKSEFELKENELQFSDLCEKLKAHPFESPWRKCFVKMSEKKPFINEVTELTIDDVGFETVCKDPASSQIESFLTSEAQKNDADQQEILEKRMLLDEIKISRIKKLLLNEDSDSLELAKDFDFLLTLPLQQVPDFCDQIKSSVLNESSAATLLNAILSFEKQISLATASVIVQNFVYPKISENEKTNSRTFSTSILKFTEAYPKTGIDEVLIPCLRKETLGTFESEILFEMVKTSLPDEYTAYCIKAVLDQAMHSENMFEILKCLVERKVQHDQNLHDLLSKKLNDLSSVCSNNLKFTKLLTSTLTVYGSMLTEEQISMYDEAVKNNKTLAKKAAENVLKKLKSNLEL
ncbi:uncharacterized protein LOC129225302 [Uloborus diversus]|uniref:uncharacterized protein LOC129225302 n=1 Tax=Uloborus diversus TaxID=327109 RepID=UPI002409171A|nr:uncharacterized protein LOC129225302 [Uloborus diversus]